MKGVSAADAWNACAISLAETARSHTYLAILANFMDVLAKWVNIALAKHVVRARAFTVHNGRAHAVVSACVYTCAMQYDARA
jgi:hypothetical protein